MASKGDNKMRLQKSFFNQSCENLAKALLGKTLVRMHDGKRLAGKIVETEAYLGSVDKAAHSYKGKTERNTAMFMDPGTAYVYSIYGTHCCMNISSQGEGAAVLLRALEPLEGIGEMKTLRANKKAEPKKPMKEVDLCNGPSKLAQALSIDKANINKQNLVTSDLIWVENGMSSSSPKVVVSKRVNIDSAEEWADKLLRFYELGNECVSVRDKKAEALVSGDGSKSSSSNGAKDSKDEGSKRKLEGSDSGESPKKISKDDKGAAARTPSGDTGNKNRLLRSFFDQPCEDLAKALIGQNLVRIHDGKRLAGTVVETEAYLGAEDKASHSFKGKAERNFVMSMDPGTVYIYSTFGTHTCFNISSQGAGALVLLRALEPQEGIEAMTSLRASSKKGDPKKPVKEEDLSNGPTKLTQALNIDKGTLNKVDLTSNDLIWVEKGESVPPSKLVSCKRVNVNEDQAEEWADKPLRFYKLGNPCVSVRDRKAEKN